MEEMRQTGQPSGVPASHLTPEEHAALTPLLKLAQLGTGQNLVERHKPAQVRRQEKKDRALSALREYGTLERAAEAAGVSRATLYRWREADEAFEAEVKQWLDEDMETELHDTLFTIAQKGKHDPKYANAAVRAAELLIRAENPRKYGDHLTTEATLTINAQMQVADNALELLRSRQAQALQELRTIDAAQITSDPPALPSTKETP